MSDPERVPTARATWKGVLQISLVTVTAVILAACEAAPINREVIASGNADVTVDVIATVEGFNVYRLRDHSSRPIYFILPGRGPIAQTMWSTCVGKRCVPHLHTVTTVLP